MRRKRAQFSNQQSGFTAKRLRFRNNKLFSLIVAVMVTFNPYNSQMN